MSSDATRPSQAQAGAICGGSRLHGKHRVSCPTCGHETDFLTSFSGPWYGDILTCLGCGDAWEGGERLERPFRREWRQEAIKRATARWENALPRDAYLAETRAALDAYFADEKESQEVPDA